MEEFKIITNYPRYSISNLGNIKNNKTNKYMMPALGSHGYLNITLSDKGNKKTFTLHKLLGLYFIPNPYNYKCIDHIDRNKLNNNISNLRWVSYTQNNQNASLCKNNKTGVQGVSYDARTSSYRAYYSENNNQKVKSFSINKYSNAKNMAIEYRYKMIKQNYINRLDIKEQLNIINPQIQQKEDICIINFEN